MDRRLNTAYGCDALETTGKVCGGARWWFIQQTAAAMEGSVIRKGRGETTERATRVQ